MAFMGANGYYYLMAINKTSELYFNRSYKGKLQQIRQSEIIFVQYFSSSSLVTREVPITPLSRIKHPLSHTEVDCCVKMNWVQTAGAYGSGAS